MPITLSQGFWWLEIYSSSVECFWVRVSYEVIISPLDEAGVTSALKQEVTVANTSTWFLGGLVPGHCWPDASVPYHGVSPRSDANIMAGIWLPLECGGNVCQKLLIVTCPLCVKNQTEGLIKTRQVPYP